MTKIEFLNVGPLTSIQDGGRFGALAYGVCASGPMDQGAYYRAGNLLTQANETPANSVLECATGELEFVLHGPKITAAFCGGSFQLKLNGGSVDWEKSYLLDDGCKVKITPGALGNYALIRLSQEFDIPPIIDSVSTNMIAKLGGFKGRMLKKGDVVPLKRIVVQTSSQPVPLPLRKIEDSQTVRVIWGLHADLFSAMARQKFLDSPFIISPMMDRMGVRLKDRAEIFRDIQHLSLVSDTIVPGDIQILGDGTPTVLMRDHQPTGGYPRIATIISADIDRFAQMRPNSEVRFTSIGVDAAHQILKAGELG